MKIRIIAIIILSLHYGKLSGAGLLTENGDAKLHISIEAPEFKRITFNTKSKKIDYYTFDNIRNELDIQKFNFQNTAREKGFKPFVAPTLLIASGTILHFSPRTKENFRDWMLENYAYSGSVDDYLQYAPGLAVYALNAFHVKGKNNFGNRTAIVIKSLILNQFIVSNLKEWVNEERPGGGYRAFPSGHTSTAFAFAQFMHNEFGERSIWYSVGAYSCAATVGLMRVAKNAHWISDVLAGAGFGMLSTEIVYLTHLYKWDNGHIKNLDIFPWRSKQYNGLAVVYNF